MVPHKPSTPHSESYDKLSRIWLTKRSLREHDRRNGQPLSTRLYHSQEPINDLIQAGKQGGKKLARFARSGGPNLCDLRGYPEQTSITYPMTLATSSTSSRREQSTQAAGEPGKRSSAYDDNFDQHLVDHNIFPPFYSFLDDIHRAIMVSRRSLSPSVVSESAFEEFQRKNISQSEGTIMRTVVPIIVGDSCIPNDGHLVFNNLDSMTGDTTVCPIPNFFDGALPGVVDKEVRKDLNSIIVPTKQAQAPIVPNLFLEVQGPGGDAEVLQRQAVHDGAYGTHLMHSLQNYLKQELVYDGNAYTFSATYLDGHLKIYAHHLTAPAHPHNMPEYHTTQLDAYALTGNSMHWAEGIRVLRTIRLLAKSYRDVFIKSANARAYRQREAADGGSADGDGARLSNEQDESSSPDDFFDCRLFAESVKEEEETPIGTSPGLAIDSCDENTSQVSEGFTTKIPSSSSQEPVSRPC